MIENPDPTFIEVMDVHHAYGYVASLNGVTLSLRRGSIHALVGEHGAGKSSLGRILAGDTVPRSGHILVEGVPAQLHRRNAALRLGIKMVYQTILLNDYFTVAESLYYANHNINRGIWVSRRKMERATGELFAARGIRLDPATEIRSLNISERTVIDILRSLQTPTSLLIVDEGLDNLSAEYYGMVLPLLHDLATQGGAVLFITHKIEDIYDVADRVSIMRNGRILATDEVRNIDKMSLLRLTYTQISKTPTPDPGQRDFDNLLKYNEAILQFLPVNLIVVDAHERIELVNTSCKEYFRLDAGYHATPLTEVLGEGNDDVLELLGEAFRTGEERTYYRVKLQTPRGDAITNMKTLPIRDGNEVIGNIVLIEDVSEFEKLQDRLILSEKLASIGLLAAGVAHEINNPLEIIYNYLAYLRFNLADGELLGVVDTIEKELVAISGIVSNLVSFSSKSTHDSEALDLDETIQDILGLLRFNAEYKSIGMSLTGGLGKARVRLNRSEFKQVILNLIRNSFEAMPGGGEIRIFTETTEREGKTLARIVVSDTGSGIAEQNLKNIFLPFFSTKKGQESNLGLGLAISYSIVQRFGGSMAAFNNPGQGCSFVLEFPLES